MDHKIARVINREIMTISRCISYIRNAQFKKYDIGRGQHAFLTRIYENPGINQEELSYMLKMDKTTVAKALKKLEENNFILRVRSEEDNRKWLLYPTDKLLSIYDELENLILSTCQNAVKGFSSDEAESLLSALRKVGQNVNEDWNKIKNDLK
ncbi:MAG TPA: MarR family transcriptional regulator [Clostridiales bacterium]|nr:MarR family transcriptional regulator [Clostridiales bacterium]